MIDIASQLPDVELVDIFGRAARTSELATTGVPILLVTTVTAPAARRLETVYMELAKLDEGDYNVWALVQGMPDRITSAFPRLTKAIRTFAFLPGWDGAEALGVGGYPTVIAANRANEVVAVVEGWDRNQWEAIVNDLRSMLNWRPTVLPRGLPPSGVIPLKQPAPS